MVNGMLKSDSFMCSLDNTKDVLGCFASTMKFLGFVDKFFTLNFKAVEQVAPTLPVPMYSNSEDDIEDDDDEGYIEDVGGEGLGGGGKDDILLCVLFSLSSSGVVSDNNVKRRSQTISFAIFTR